MSIWTYDDSVREIGRIAAGATMTDCLYCHTLLETPFEDPEHPTDNTMYSQSSLLIRCCPVCGWWTKLQRDNFHGIQLFGDAGGPALREQHFGAVGSLLELDLKDQSIPMEEIRGYLAAKYDARFNVDPWKFEEVVASVYKDHGYEARVTARSGDGGIDTILDGPDDSVIGVQVKRYKGRICVEQIRSLAGALLLNGLTQGMFVTTSTFQSGAHSTVEQFRLRGMPIELIDAKRFYDALCLAQRTKYNSNSDPTAPFFHAKLTLIHDYDQAEEFYGK